MRFKEIEHKFVVDERFDLAAFGRIMKALGPERQTSLRVRDRYFLTVDGLERRYVVRHRFDAELHQLTLKSMTADPEVRDEISLNLGHHAGPQDAEVDAFVTRLGLTWSGVIEKELHVWYFPDCEVVHYVAMGGGLTVRCVEFEAVRASSVPAALSVLARYERATGLDRAMRSLQSLPALLFPATFSA